MCDKSHTEQAAFRFNPNTSRQRISNEKFLAGLRRFAKLKGRRRFSMEAFEAWKGKPFSARACRVRFGTWHEALVKAGLPGALSRRYKPAELMDTLERIWRKTARAPSHRDLEQEGITEWPYRRYWGSLPSARQRLADFKDAKITREELLTPTAPARPRRTRRPLSQSTRLRVLMRDGQRCVICGQRAREGAVLEVDHIVPVCRGGGDGMENLRTLCRACNRGKGARAA